MTPDKYNNDLSVLRASNDGRFILADADKFPCLNDDTATHENDPHYIYHTAWAARRLGVNKPKNHVDISSYLYFSTIISGFIPTEFYDYRPVYFKLDNFSSKRADLMGLDFPDNSVESLSCMHVIEHIGLGRYGDSLNIKGDEQAFKELTRVTAPNGKLYIVLPVGNISKICFNAHRIYTYDLILSYFTEFNLTNSALVCNRANEFVLNPNKDIFYQQFYGCGCFEFTKKS